MLRRIGRISEEEWSLRDQILHPPELSSSSSSTNKNTGGTQRSNKDGRKAGKNTNKEVT